MRSSSLGLPTLLENHYPTDSWDLNATVVELATSRQRVKMAKAAILIRASH